MIKFMTWFWKQTPQRGDYDAEKVNRWAAMLRTHLTIPHVLACVTDHPEGIDEDVEILPLSEVVSPHLMKINAPGWSEASGMPQCYRRLELFNPRAADIFGAEWLVSMDCDCAGFGNLDSLFTFEHDFRMFAGTSAKRPYNGSMVMIKAGARPQVYEQLNERGIAESRRKFVGSDQAWISHCLGWDEATWTAARDGVHAWGTGFVVRNTGPRGFMLPGDTRLLFFPAHPKPWQLKDSYPQVYGAWAGEELAKVKAFSPNRKKDPNRLRLWAFDDPKGWGKQFQIRAKAKGHRGWLFTNPAAVSDGEPAFVRLDQQGAQRDLSRSIVARLGERGIVTLPTPQEALWYDDKLAQYPALKKWLPETWIEADRAKAEERIEMLTRADAFPIISKAAAGAGSANVRVLNNPDEAWAESFTAFGTGIPLKYGRIQEGYVYWQRLVPDNPCDYRTVIVGDYLYGLVRKNKPGTVFASGSGVNYPMTLDNTREYNVACATVQIAKELGTRWMAFDFVFDGEIPVLLEMSSAWTMKAYEECPMFTLALKPSGRKGSESFDVAVEMMIEAGRKLLEEAA